MNTPTPEPVLYKSTAQFIYNTKLMATDPKPDGNGCPSQGFLYQALNDIKTNNQDWNIWRTAWALDTLLDYFTDIDGSDADNLSSWMIQYGLNARGGNWWDDYGWSGIAALRAAKNANISAANQDNYFKSGINSWCYMFGNGWKKGTHRTDPKEQFTVPFPDQAGWAYHIENGPDGEGNIGAPNVFDYLDGAYPGWQPLFTPGGIWNSSISGSVGTHQSATQVSCNDPMRNSFLNPLQNTVTNGIFMVLTLRAYEATQDIAYQALLESVGLDASVVKQAWVDQINWFYNWFYNGIDASSLLYRLSSGYEPGFGSALVRERVPRFYNNTWDAAYCDKLAWTGDQGLLLGALREAEVFLKSPLSDGIAGKAEFLQNVTPIYKDLINGVFTHANSTEAYPNDPTNPLGNGTKFLRPWVEVADNSGSYTNTYISFPQGDDPDYYTGVGVFCRYLLQAYRADSSVLTTDQENAIIAAANQLCDPDFPEADKYERSAWSYDPSKMIECDGILQRANNFPPRT